MCNAPGFMSGADAAGIAPAQAQMQLRQLQPGAGCITSVAPARSAPAELPPGLIKSLLSQLSLSEDAAAAAGADGAGSTDASEIVVEVDVGAQATAAAKQLAASPAERLELQQQVQLELAHTESGASPSDVSAFEAVHTSDVSASASYSVSTYSSRSLALQGEPQLPLKSRRAKKYSLGQNLALVSSFPLLLSAAPPCNRCHCSCLPRPHWGWRANRLLAAKYGYGCWLLLVGVLAQRQLQLAVRGRLQCSSSNWNFVSPIPNQGRTLKGGKVIK